METDPDNEFQGILTKLRTTRGSQFAIDTMTEAADRIEELKRELAERPSRHAIESAVGEVLWHASNYPEAAQSRILGQDIKPLRDKVTDAVMRVLEAKDG